MLYQIIWYPRFEFNSVKGDVKETLKSILETVCNKYDLKILKLDIETDYIGIILSAQPTFAPIDIVRILKSVTTVQLISEFSSLRKVYSLNGSLWQENYYINTIGKINNEITKEYIQGKNLEEE